MPSIPYRLVVVLIVVVASAMAARAAPVTRPPTPLALAAPLAGVVALSAGAQEEDDEAWDDEENVEDDSESAEDDSESLEDDSESVEDDSEGAEDDAEGLDEPSDEVETASASDDDSDAAEDEVEYIDDYEDDAWAGEDADEPDTDESDDAIAYDDSFDEDLVYEVEAVEDGNGVVEDTGQREDEDGFAVGEILQLGTARRAAPGSRPSSGSSRPSSGGGRAAAPRPAGAGAAGAAGEDVPYAFGGRPVLARAVPWQAQIFNPGVVRNPDNPRPIWMRQHNCGGALIADDWVLTAAHCIDQQKVDLGFKVRLGAQDLSQGDGLVYRIERIVRHSQYDPGSRDLTRPPNMYANDIALLRIVPDGPPQRRDPALIRPIPLNRQPLPGGLPVTVTGWGAVGNDTQQAGSAVILRVDLRLMDNATCSARPGRAGKVGPGVFCAASPTQSTCSGDSGGPVVPTNGTPVLAGLVSWGSSRCGGDGRPSVYTRVDQYLGWIEQAMRLPPTRNHLP